MKLFFVSFLLFLSSSIFSQKIYHFDYVLEYDSQLKKGDSISKEFFYVNSKDNSYKMRVVEKDSLNFRIDFLDVTGNYAVVYILKDDFLKVATITVPCKFVKYYSTRNLRTKDYSFSPLNDTVINKVSYYHYVLKSKSIQREKRKKLSRAHYIIDKESSFHFPFFFETLDLEVWIRDRSVLNGVPFMMFFSNPVDPKVSLFRTLVNRKTISIQLKIPDECDYEKMIKNLSSIRINQSPKNQ